MGPFHFHFNGYWVVFFFNSIKILKEHSVSSGDPDENLIWPRGYKPFFMLNSTEHKISTAHKTKIPTKKFLALSLSDVVFKC